MQLNLQKRIILMCSACILVSMVMLAYAISFPAGGQVQVNAEVRNVEPPFASNKDRAVYYSSSPEGSSTAYFSSASEGRVRARIVIDPAEKNDDGEVSDSTDNDPSQDDSSAEVAADSETPDSDETHQEDQEPIVE